MVFAFVFDIKYERKNFSIMDYTVKHDADRHRFETTVDGYTGYVEYVAGRGTLDIIHTIVPMKIEGRGVAAALVKAAYEYARENGLKVIPSCSYAAMWVRRHPEYDEMTM